MEHLSDDSVIANDLTPRAQLMVTFGTCFDAFCAVGLSLSSPWPQVCVPERGRDDLFSFLFPLLFILFYLFFFL